MAQWDQKRACGSLMLQSVKLSGQLESERELDPNSLLYLQAFEHNNRAGALGLAGSAEEGRRAIPTPKAMKSAKTPKSSLQLMDEDATLENTGSHQTAVSSFCPHKHTVASVLTHAQLDYVLSIANCVQVLPKREDVLFCSETTTIEEIRLFFRRALCRPRGAWEKAKAELEQLESGRLSAGASFPLTGHSASAGREHKRDQRTTSSTLLLPPDDGTTGLDRKKGIRGATSVAKPNAKASSATSSSGGGLFGKMNLTLADVASSTTAPESRKKKGKTNAAASASQLLDHPRTNVKDEQDPDEADENISTGSVSATKHFFLVSIEKLQYKVAVSAHHVYLEECRRREKEDLKLAADFKEQEEVLDPMKGAKKQKKHLQRLQSVQDGEAGAAAVSSTSQNAISSGLFEAYKSDDDESEEDEDVDMVGSGGVVAVQDRYKSTKFSTRNHLVFFCSEKAARQSHLFSAFAEQKVSAPKLPSLRDMREFVRPQAKGFFKLVCSADAGGGKTWLIDHQIEQIRQKKEKKIEDWLKSQKNASSSSRGSGLLNNHHSGLKAAPQTASKVPCRLKKIKIVLFKEVIDEDALCRRLIQESCNLQEIVPEVAADGGSKNSLNKKGTKTNFKKYFQPMDRTLAICSTRHSNSGREYGEAREQEEALQGEQQFGIALAIHLVLPAGVRFQNVNDILFKLVVLRTLETKDGSIWRVGAEDVCFLETSNRGLLDFDRAQEVKGHLVASPNANVGQALLKMEDPDEDAPPSMRFLDLYETVEDETDSKQLEDAEAAAQGTNFDFVRNFLKTKTRPSRAISVQHDAETSVCSFASYLPRLDLLTPVELLRELIAEACGAGTTTATSGKNDTQHANSTRADDAWRIQAAGLLDAAPGHQESSSRNVVPPQEQSKSKFEYVAEFLDEYKRQESSRKNDIADQNQRYTSNPNQGQQNNNQNSRARNYLYYHADRDCGTWRKEHQKPLLDWLRNEQGWNFVTAADLRIFVDQKLVDVKESASGDIKQWRPRRSKQAGEPAKVPKDGRDADDELHYHDAEEGDEDEFGDDYYEEDDGAEDDDSLYTLDLTNLTIPSSVFSQPTGGASSSSSSAPPAAATSSCPSKDLQRQIHILQNVIKYCGVENPCWGQLTVFVDFLEKQLRTCEKNVFANCPDEGLGTFRAFVVRFMVQMSRDFATPSLCLTDESNGLVPANETAQHHNDPDVYEQDLSPRLAGAGAESTLRRTWESTPHPYLFFQSDGQSMTFLGFAIDSETGHLLDRKSDIVIEKNIMGLELFDALQGNGVKLNEDFGKLPKLEKIKKLLPVLSPPDVLDALSDFGKEDDPDQSFELTLDNCQKLLAMHVRFHCGIPVCLFGETGIGKTRLVEYYAKLCAALKHAQVRQQDAMLRQFGGGAAQQVQMKKANIKVVKVHGGTDKEDVWRAVADASRMAERNFVDENIQTTVLFFDECNTSYAALWLCQELMSDRTFDGQRVIAMERFGLKICIACNPYRRHSPELIARMAKSGLGYHHDSTTSDTDPAAATGNNSHDAELEQATVQLRRDEKQELIPIRHLVYRVHPLPPSLRIHIYDFGCLSEESEASYIQLLVRRELEKTQKQSLLAATSFDNSNGDHGGAAAGVVVQPKHQDADVDDDGMPMLVEAPAPGSSNARPDMMTFDALCPTVEWSSKFKDPRAVPLVEKLLRTATRADELYIYYDKDQCETVASVASFQDQDADASIVQVRVQVFSSVHPPSPFYLLCDGTTHTEKFPGDIELSNKKLPVFSLNVCKNMNDRRNVFAPWKVFRMDREASKVAPKNVRTAVEQQSSRLRQCVWNMLQSIRSSSSSSNLDPAARNAGQMAAASSGGMTRRDTFTIGVFLQSTMHKTQKQIARVLQLCQKFMKNSKTEKSFVSLRDVERCLSVYHFFCTQLENKALGELWNNKTPLESAALRDPEKANHDLHEAAFICSLGVCYYLALAPASRSAFLTHVCYPISKKSSRSGGNEAARADEYEADEEKCKHKLRWLTKQNFEATLKTVMDFFMQELSKSANLEDKNIAENQALTENVFLMTICAELRIPLFIVGKPGTSKSLARSLVDDAMKGKSSQSPLYQTLKQCVQVSYQCSPLSTSDGIMKVFRDCSRRQRGKDLEESVAVAVLDEVGLAEYSDTMALKTLHPLLETGCSPEGSFDDAEPYFKTGFYGISNWSLDPAKMNRGILVSRDEPDEKELQKTGAKILRVSEDDKMLEIIVATYTELYKTQGQPEIHGLRDFYCLLKMIGQEADKRKWSVSHVSEKVLQYKKRQEDAQQMAAAAARGAQRGKKSQQVAAIKAAVGPGGAPGAAPTAIDLEVNRCVVVISYCLRRNFTTCGMSRIDAVALFHNNLFRVSDVSHEPTQALEAAKIFAGAVAAASSSSAPRPKKEHLLPLDEGEPEDDQRSPRDVAEDPHEENGEGENSCSVQVLDMLLDNLRHSDPDGSDPVRYPLIVARKGFAALHVLQENNILNCQNSKKVEILFGSSFKNDHEYTNICRAINAVKLCLEKGVVCVLVNLGMIYESIYDALNQYYTLCGGNKYVDLGLGTNRFKCRVHADARLVIVATKEEILRDFPVPLINRLEKHEVSVKLALRTEVEKRVAFRLRNWALRFGKVVRDGTAEATATPKLVVDKTSAAEVSSSQKLLGGEAGVDVDDVEMLNEGADALESEEVQQVEAEESLYNSFVGFDDETCYLLVAKAGSEFTFSEKTQKQDYETALFQRTRELLLQTATPEAVLRYGACCSATASTGTVAASSSSTLLVGDKNRADKQLDVGTTARDDEVPADYFRSDTRELLPIIRAPQDAMQKHFQSRASFGGEQRMKTPSPLRDRTDSKKSAGGRAGGLDAIKAKSAQNLDYIQVTTFARLLTQVDLNRLCEGLAIEPKKSAMLVSLNEIQSESNLESVVKQFCKAEATCMQGDDAKVDVDGEDLIDSFQSNLLEPTSSSATTTSSRLRRRLLIVQSSENFSAAGTSSSTTTSRGNYNNLIECARYCVQNTAAKHLKAPMGNDKTAMSSSCMEATTILFLVQLPVVASSLAEYAGQPAGWRCYHVDDLTTCSIASTAGDVATGSDVDTAAPYLPRSIMELRQLGSIEAVLRKRVLFLADQEREKSTGSSTSQHGAPKPSTSRGPSPEEIYEPAEAVQSSQIEIGMTQMIPEDEEEGPTQFFISDTQEEGRLHRQGGGQKNYHEDHDGARKTKSQREVGGAINVISERVLQQSEAMLRALTKNIIWDACSRTADDPRRELRVRLILRFMEETSSSRTMPDAPGGGVSRAAALLRGMFARVADVLSTGAASGTPTTSPVVNWIDAVAQRQRSVREGTFRDACVRTFHEEAAKAFAVVLADCDLCNNMDLLSLQEDRWCGTLQRLPQTSVPAQTWIKGLFSCQLPFFPHLYGEARQLAIKDLQIAEGNENSGQELQGQIAQTTHANSSSTSSDEEEQQRKNDDRIARDEEEVIHDDFARTDSSRLTTAKEVRQFYEGVRKSEALSGLLVEERNDIFGTSKKKTTSGGDKPEEEQPKSSPSYLNRLGGLLSKTTANLLDRLGGSSSKSNSVHEASPLGQVTSATGRENNQGASSNTTKNNGSPADVMGLSQSYTVTRVYCCDLMRMLATTSLGLDALTEHDEATRSSNANNKSQSSLAARAVKTSGRVLFLMAQKEAENHGDILDDAEEEGNGNENNRYQEVLVFVCVQILFEKLRQTVWRPLLQGLLLEARVFTETACNVSATKQLMSALDADLFKAYDSSKPQRTALKLVLAALTKRISSSVVQCFRAKFLYEDPELLIAIENPDHEQQSRDTGGQQHASTARDELLGPASSSSAAGHGSLMSGIGSSSSSSSNRNNLPDPALRMATQRSQRGEQPTISWIPLDHGSSARTGVIDAVKSLAVLELPGFLEHLKRVERFCEDVLEDLMQSCNGDENAGTGGHKAKDKVPAEGRAGGADPSFGSRRQQEQYGVDQLAEDADMEPADSASADTALLETQILVCRQQLSSVSLLGAALTHFVLPEVAHAVVERDELRFGDITQLATYSLKDEETLQKTVQPKIVDTQTRRLLLARRVEVQEKVELLASKNKSRQQPGRLPRRSPRDQLHITKTIYRAHLNPALFEAFFDVKSSPITKVDGYRKLEEALRAWIALAERYERQDKLPIAIDLDADVDMVGHQQNTDLDADMLTLKRREQCTARVRNFFVDAIAQQFTAVGCDDEGVMHALTEIVACRSPSLQSIFPSIHHSSPLRGLLIKVLLHQQSLVEKPMAVIALLSDWTLNDPEMNKPPDCLGLDDSTGAQQAEPAVKRRRVELLAGEQADSGQKVCKRKKLDSVLALAPATASGALQHLLNDILTPARDGSTAAGRSLFHDLAQRQMEADRKRITQHSKNAAKMLVAAVENLLTYAPKRNRNSQDEDIDMDVAERGGSSSASGAGASSHAAENQQMRLNELQSFDTERYKAAFGLVLQFSTTLLRSAVFSLLQAAETSDYVLLARSVGQVRLAVDYAAELTYYCRLPELEQDLRQRWTPFLSTMEEARLSNPNGPSNPGTEQELDATITLHIVAASLLLSDDETALSKMTAFSEIDPNGLKRYKQFQKLLASQCRALWLRSLFTRYGWDACESGCRTFAPEILFGGEEAMQKACGRTYAPHGLAGAGTIPLCEFIDPECKVLEAWRGARHNRTVPGTSFKVEGFDSKTATLQQKLAAIVGTLEFQAEQGKVNIAQKPDILQKLLGVRKVVDYKNAANRTGSGPVFLRSLRFDETADQDAAANVDTNEKMLAYLDTLWSGIALVLDDESFDGSRVSSLTHVDRYGSILLGFWGAIFGSSAPRSHSHAIFDPQCSSRLNERLTDDTTKNFLGLCECLRKRASGAEAGAALEALAQSLQLSVPDCAYFLLHFFVESFKLAAEVLEDRQNDQARELRPLIECNVCMEAIALPERVVVFSQCMHHHCIGCVGDIKATAHSNNECPVCRTKIKFDVKKLHRNHNQTMDVYGQLVKYDAVKPPNPEGALPDTYKARLCLHEAPKLLTHPFGRHLWQAMVRNLDLQPFLNRQARIVADLQQKIVFSTRVESAETLLRRRLKEILDTENATGSRANSKQAGPASADQPAGGAGAPPAPSATEVLLQCSKSSEDHHPFGAGEGGNFPGLRQSLWTAKKPAVSVYSLRSYLARQSVAAKSGASRRAKSKVDPAQEALLLQTKFLNLVVNNRSDPGYATLAHVRLLPDLLQLLVEIRTQFRMDMLQGLSLGQLVKAHYNHENFGSLLSNTSTSSANETTTASKKRPAVQLPAAAPAPASSGGRPCPLSAVRKSKQLQSGVLQSEAMSGKSREVESARLLKSLATVLVQACQLCRKLEAESAADVFGVDGLCERGIAALIKTQNRILQASDVQQEKIAARGMKAQSLTAQGRKQEKNRCAEHLSEYAARILTSTTDFEQSLPSKENDIARSSAVRGLFVHVEVEDHVLPVAELFAAGESVPALDAGSASAASASTTFDLTAISETLTEHHLSGKPHLPQFAELRQGVTEKITLLHREKLLASPEFAVNWWSWLDGSKNTASSQHGALMLRPDLFASSSQANAIMDKLQLQAAGSGPGKTARDDQVTDHEKDFESENCSQRGLQQEIGMWRLPELLDAMSKIDMVMRFIGSTTTGRISTKLASTPLMQFIQKSLSQDLFLQLPAHLRNLLTPRADICLQVSDCATLQQLLLVRRSLLITTGSSTSTSGAAGRRVFLQNPAFYEAKVPAELKNILARTIDIQPLLLVQWTCTLHRLLLRWTEHEDPTQMDWKRNNTADFSSVRAPGEMTAADQMKSAIAAKQAAQRFLHGEVVDMEVDDSINAAPPAGGPSTGKRPAPPESQLSAGTPFFATTGGAAAGGPKAKAKAKAKAKVKAKAKPKVKAKAKTKAKAKAKSRAASVQLESSQDGEDDLLAVDPTQQGASSSTRKKAPGEGGADAPPSSAGALDGSAGNETAGGHQQLPGGGGADADARQRGRGGDTVLSQGPGRNRANNRPAAIDPFRPELDLPIQLYQVAGADVVGFPDGLLVKHAVALFYYLAEYIFEAKS
ncbi:unnamed protein product [Amoebophrya sp. A120]|nr:unnamed protein product [Amoebophrya sp. A120]|eukprot:GSA120T00006326001.1